MVESDELSFRACRVDGVGASDFRVKIDHPQPIGGLVPVSSEDDPVFEQDCEFVFLVDGLAPCIAQHTCGQEWLNGQIFEDIRFSRTQGESLQFKLAPERGRHRLFGRGQDSFGGVLHDISQEM